MPKIKPDEKLMNFIEEVTQEEYNALTWFINQKLFENRKSISGRGNSYPKYVGKHLSSLNKKGLIRAEPTSWDTYLKLSHMGMYVHSVMLAHSLISRR